MATASEKMASFSARVASDVDSPCLPLDGADLSEAAQAGRDLTCSLDRLSLSSRSPSSHSPSSRSPSSRSPSSRSPSSHTPRAQKSYQSLQQAVRSSSRSPLPRSPSMASMSRVPARSPLATGRDSRSATPTLLRKASINSLHSVNGITPARGPVRRASSSSLRSPSTSHRSPRHSAMPELPERPAQTAASIARNHFREELEFHHGPGSTTNSETIVVLHDACYGHRYSRPRTSRAVLSTVVERPERVRATVLGVALAYVRLGERHADGLYAPHPQLEPAGIPEVPFLIRKSTRRVPLTSTVVTHVHGIKWMEELKVMCDTAESKLATNGKELQRPSSAKGGDGSSQHKFHEGDLYLCSESLDAMEGALGAVCEAVDEVFAASGPRRAYVAIRPPGHHCSASWPSGFCWINNVQVGIMHSILNYGLTHAAVIDFDLHHGDGSQAITWTHNTRAAGLSKNAAAWKRTSIAYYSLHDINSYPCETGDEEKVRNASICIENAHGQNVWNVHLQPWKSDLEFWELYETRYMIILEKCRAYLKHQTERFRSLNQTPKAAIFISAGFDASEWESSGMQRHNVNVPTDFYARITRDIVKLADEEGISVDGRVISVLEGGYSDRALCSATLSHVSGLAGDDPMAKDKLSSGHTFGMSRKVNNNSRGRSPAESTMTYESQASTARPYDPSWWTIKELEEMEREMATKPVPSPVSMRKTSPPTYSSPTQSSTAKAVAVPKIRRSVSGLSISSNYSCPSSPLSPEVHWTVAAHELSKLLIPTNRTTISCKHEELSAEATRIRRDRQSIFSQNDGAVSSVSERIPSRMNLRERKPKTILVEEDEKKSRRKTVAVVPSDRPQSRINSMRSTSRRLSATSTVGVSSSCEPQPPIPLVSESNILPSPTESTYSRVSAADTRLNTKRRRAAPKEPVPVKPSRAIEPRNASPSMAKTAAKPTITIAKPATIRSAYLPSQHSVDADSSDPVDALTTGVKKIKLTVLNKQQREARERERSGVSNESTNQIISPTPLTTENYPETNSESRVSPFTSALVIEPSKSDKPLISPSMLGRQDSVKRLAQAFEDQSPQGIAISSPSQYFSQQLTPPRKVSMSAGQEAARRFNEATISRNSDLSPIRPMSSLDVPVTDSNSKVSGSMLPPEHIPVSPPRFQSAQNSPPRSAKSSMVVTDFVQYQPSGPTPVAVPINEPLQWQGPVVDGSVSGMFTPGPTPKPTPGPTPVKREQLPVFGPQSVIPFADRRP